jgi:uncharacterized integral membrane protein
MAGQPGQGARQGRGVNGWLIGGGIIAALLIIFIVQNTDDTKFQFLFWSFTLPLWLGLLITSIAAFLIGQFALMWRRHQRRKTRRDGR